MDKLIGTARPVVRPVVHDYSGWTIEELRKFAQQLRVRDARCKNRRELIELFDVPARAPRH
jgi:hypothetical protein